MNVLLTGAAGFIGSNLIDHLTASGHFVIGVDNFNNFYDPRIKRENICEYLAIDNFVLEEGDLTNEDFVANLFKKWGIDSIIHLAGYGGVTQSMKDPFTYEKSNYLSTAILLEFAARNSVFDFVFASSSSVYWGSKELPFKETIETSRPVSVYAATKKCAEVISYTYAHNYGINVSGLRFFNAYGPRQRIDMAIPNFVRKIHRGEPIPVYQDMDTGRDYTYIDDICRGIVASLEKRYDYEIFNLGNNKPTKMGDLINTIENVTGKKAKVKVMQRRKGEVELTWADVKKSYNMLGFKPSTTIEVGVKKYYEWFLKTPKWYKDIP